MVIFTTPNLLIVDCLQHYSNQFEPVHTPAQSLMFGGSKYHLGSIMYGNGGHFCCTVFIFGRFLFYDGMKTPKAQWLDPDNISHPEQYHIVMVWYTRSDTSSSEPTTLTPLAVDRHMTPVLKHDTRISSINIPSSPPALSPVPELAALQRPKRTHHPIGISVSTVGQKGAIPRCKACGAHIERGTSRFVLREITNEQKGWSSTAHFHLVNTCVSRIAPQYQVQIQQHLKSDSE